MAPSVSNAHRKFTQFCCNRETPCVLQHSGNEHACGNPCGSAASPASRLCVVRCITYHNGLSRWHSQLSQRQSDEPWIRFAVLDVIATSRGINQVIDIHQG